MSPKKIYILSIVIGLVIGLIVIVAVKYSSTPGAQPTTSTVSTTPPGWVEVTPPTRLFTASFPVSPERTVAELPISGTDYSLMQESHVAIDGKGNVFRIVTFIYPQPFGAEQANEVLDAALQGMVAAAAGSTLLEATTATLDTLPSKLFTIQDTAGYYHQGEMFLKGRVLYQAFVTYASGDLVEGDLNHFLDSLTPTVDSEPVQ